MTQVLDSDGHATVVSDRVLVGWLVTWSHRRGGQDYRLYEGRNVVGRAAGAAGIVVDDDAMGDPHAVIRYLEGQFDLKDEMTTNGTRRNGSLIRTEVVLHDGDTIKLGRTEFVFRSARPMTRRPDGSLT